MPPEELLIWLPISIKLRTFVLTEFVTHRILDNFSDNLHGRKWRIWSTMQSPQAIPSY
jgi:hypothetical protein